MALARRSNFRRRSTTRRSRRGTRRTTKRSSAMPLARRALRLAKRIANASTETKYFSLQSITDLAGTGGFLRDSYNLELTDTAGYTPIFNGRPLTGNKAYLKYLRGTWDIHMDNVNNEEETVNFTVSVIKLKSDGDYNLFGNLLSGHVSTIQGQAYFDPRFFKVVYQKRFTLTMGGTSPGTAGESRRFGKFFIPVKKMIRFRQEGVAGAINASVPMSAQDRYWFCVHTDNSAVDTESPRLNAHFMACWLDEDHNV